MDLLWPCNVCKEPVAADDGYMQVDQHAALEARRTFLEDEHRRRCRIDAGESPFKVYTFTGSELGAAWPEPVPWRIYHRACDPDADGGQYWFAIERIGTLAFVVNWTAHLLSKSWLPWTNWDDVCRQARYLAGETEEA